MHRRILFILLAACALLSACAAPVSPQEVTDVRRGGCAYETPEYHDAAFHEELAEGIGAVKIDISAANEGYVAVSASSSSKLKFQVIKGESVYTYCLSSDGTPAVFPLNGGNGEYRFRVMENTAGSRYAELYSASCSVALLDEFQPFLRPSVYVPYSRSSACVRKAEELAASSANEAELVCAICQFICSTVCYDTHKAKTVTSDYLPDPDETLRTGKGICFDYASLAAAMLRSQGIPTKVVFGYVPPDGAYHAWNMVYTAEPGGDGWSCLDLTVAANTANGQIAAGSGYQGLYCY